MKSITDKWDLALAELKNLEYSNIQREAYLSGVYQALLSECEVDSTELQELAKLRFIES